ncbi:hypothetical protein RM533_03305 [Croceicoccus sp. F390]|uniref:Uncharacterized protein n=1 Tax=Croceicoccus esteveae TaxID=3075597 RepID=A0ABU2ZF38_9SPHN|nr:hypothetical protein [Croceicoccus sp. F390]MDT0575210.1 hypothetical protein [Croceicoccus sp. F390]
MRRQDEMLDVKSIYVTGAVLLLVLLYAFIDAGRVEPRLITQQVVLTPGAGQ